MPGAEQAYHANRNEIKRNDVVQQLGHDQDKNACGQGDERHEMIIHIVCGTKSDGSATI